MLVETKKKTKKKITYFLLMDKLVKNVNVESIRKLLTPRQLKEILPNTLPTERLSLNTIDDQSRLVYFDQISITSRKDLISNLPDDGFFNTEKRISVGSFSNLTPYDLNELNKLQSGTRSHTSARIIDSTGAEGEGGGGGTVTEIQTWY